MATLAIIIGICLTVIGMIDGLVAFWKVMTEEPVTCVQSDVVKVLTYEGERYAVRQEHISKFGAKCFDDENGVPTNPRCVQLIDRYTAEDVPTTHYLEACLSLDLKMRLANVADAIRDIDSSWEDVNQILFGTGLIMIGLGMLMLGMTSGIILVFFGAFKVM
jgi:hypothetical protein